VQEKYEGRTELYYVGTGIGSMRFH
jgi:hypothetical protein